MALSYDTGVGTGIETTFPFSFAGEGYGYISESDIVVEVDLVATTAFELTGPNQVTFDVAPADGAAIRILRVMDKETIYALFDRGNDFTKDKVNNNLLQMLYTIHEFLDGFVEDDAVAVQDLIMGGFQITGLGDGVDPQDAVTVAQVAAAGASATESAASAADALVSENACAADLVLTNADVVLTGLDVDSTNADVVLTGDDVVAAQAILDEFGGLYYGALAVAPTTSIAVGDLYFDTVDEAMKVCASTGPDVWDAVSANLTNYYNKTEQDVTDAALQLAADNGINFKNKIINGGFDIWQRATSQTSSGYGSDDRWSNGNFGSTKTHTRQTFALGQTAVAGDPKYYSRTVVSSVAGAGNYIFKAQSIERVQLLAGKTVSLSFDAKADANKNIAIEFYQRFGTGGSPSSDVSQIGVQKIALTTSWQRFDIEVALPSISGKTLGTNDDDSLQLAFWFDAGSNYNLSTDTLGQQSGTFELANVQIEEGSTATDFEQRPLSIEEMLCYRYYIKRFISFRHFATAVDQLIYVEYPLPVKLRSQLPTIITSLVLKSGDWDIHAYRLGNIEADFSTLSIGMMATAPSIVGYYYFWVKIDAEL